MSTLKVNKTHNSDEINSKITSIKNYNDVIDWKIIQCVNNNPGIEASTIAKVMNVSIKKVYYTVQQYNKMGKQYKENTQWGGRRKERSYLSIDDERKILDKFSQKASKGMIITAKDIKSEFEKVIGKSVSVDYVWKVFKRHNWSKKTPRPKHPKTDYEKQEEFKKNSMKTWQPPV